VSQPKLALAAAYAEPSTVDELDRLLDAPHRLSGAAPEVVATPAVEFKAIPIEYYGVSMVGVDAAPSRRQWFDLDVDREARCICGKRISECPWRSWR